MTRALIGHTGFVGSNLVQQSRFGDCFNSKNINDIRGREFSELWCAGIQAVKWWANRNPEQDWSGIERLLDALQTVRCGTFILISTVDVFAQPRDVDEGSFVNTSALEPYGLHRHRVEEWVRRQFANTLIIRLPGLFGTGLKKNIIYDMLHGHQLENIHADAVFQFYNLNNLTRDARIASSANLDLIHLVPEPVRVAQVGQAVTDKPFNQRPQLHSIPHYDVHTRHGGLWKQAGPYIETAQHVLADIHRFAQERATG